MFRFLRWRFGKFAKPVRFDAAVITHPDQDHYFGFQPLFEEPNVAFGTVYHNGIVERVSASANDRLGPRWKDPATREVYLEDVAADLPALRRVLDDPALISNRQYPTLLKTALDGGRVAVGLLLYLWRASRPMPPPTPPAIPVPPRCPPTASCGAATSPRNPFPDPPRCRTGVADAI
ncbi:MAG: hypothetical protein HC897_07585 [Thermoanaerobaculia bacterium]|nr:hypothetical protein [Thermoanaerobaculia bacterium]